MKQLLGIFIIVYFLIGIDTFFLEFTAEKLIHTFYATVGFFFNLKEWDYLEMYPIHTGLLRVIMKFIFWLILTITIFEKIRSFIFNYQLNKYRKKRAIKEAKEKNFL